MVEIVGPRGGTTAAFAASLTPPHPLPRRPGKPHRDQTMAAPRPPLPLEPPPALGRTGLQAVLGEIQGSEEREGGRVV